MATVNASVGGILPVKLAMHTSALLYREPYNRLNKFSKAVMAIILHTLLTLVSKIMHAHLSFLYVFQVLMR